MRKLIDQLKSEWPATYSLQPKTKQERCNVIEIQLLKKDAAKEIERLIGLIEEHNAELVCDKVRCGYDGYKRDCPDCPLQWRIEVNNV